MISEGRRRRRERIVNAIRKSPPAALAAPDVYPPTEVAAMLREIGIALVEVAQPTPIVENRLQRIAARYTTESVRVVVLPTTLLIQIGDNALEIDGSTRSSLQLDAAGRIDDIASLAEAGAVSPTEAVAAVSAARTMAPRYGKWAMILGYAVTTVGFGIMINPTWASLPGYFFLGLVVGTIVMFATPALTPILPTLCAMVVTLLATWFVADTANDGLLRVISPALVATLPGMALTTGATELASSQIISGSSRLVYGISQLALLVFGVNDTTHLTSLARWEAALGSMAEALVARRGNALSGLFTQARDHAQPQANGVGGGGLFFHLQRAIPPARHHIHRQHRHPVPLRVLHQLRG